jgi:hypothetical protein
MNRKEISKKMAYIDDLYVHGFQGGIIDREDLHKSLDEILLECVPTEIREYYQQIGKDVGGFGHAP